VRRIGWSSAFKISRVETWARRRGDMEVRGSEPLFPAGFFKLMRLRKAG
jgi:phosphatidylethanolamine/phosphatidyl-N-methylethanolamine N-methyltransferase